MKILVRNLVKFSVAFFLIVSHLILLGSMTQVQAEDAILLDRPVSVSKVSDLQFALLETQQRNTSLTMDLSGSLTTPNVLAQGSESKPIELSITGEPQHVFAISVDSSVLLSNGEQTAAMTNIQHTGRQFAQFDEYGNFSLKASGSFEIPQLSMQEPGEYVGILPISIEY